MLIDNSATFQVDVLHLLNKLKTKKEMIQQEFEQRLAEVDREIEAVNITARLLRTPIMPEKEPVPLNIAETDLAGKNARQALIAIARKNDGVVRVTQAKSILLSAGIRKKRRNSWGVVNTTLSRSREFEKIEPGTFRLVESQANKALPLQ